jgi:predicted nucleic acid-binding protein
VTPAVVLDASAGVEVAVWTEQGARLARHVLAADEIVVPDHFHLECASAVRRIEIRGEVSPTEAQTALDRLLDLRVRRVSTTPLLGEAWDMRHNVTVADALYVIIARLLRVALVTGDAAWPGLPVSASNPQYLLTSASVEGPLRRQRLRARP